MIGTFFGLVLDLPVFKLTFDPLINVVPLLARLACPSALIAAAPKLLTVKSDTEYNCKF